MHLAMHQDGPCFLYKLLDQDPLVVLAHVVTLHFITWPLLLSSPFTRAKALNTARCVCRSEAGDAGNPE